jgi:hypothetical protein
MDKKLHTKRVWIGKFIPEPFVWETELAELICLVVFRLGILSVQREHPHENAVGAHSCGSLGLSFCFSWVLDKIGE